MSGELDKVSPGSPLRIPAAAYNAFIDAAEDYRRRSLVPSRAGGPDWRGVEVRVQNWSAGGLDYFAVVGLDVPVIGPDECLDDFRRRLALGAYAPSLPSHAEKFAILQEPLPVNGTGRAVIAGVTVCKVNVSDEGHGFAHVVDGETGYLESAASGPARILWHEDGTGVKWAVVLLAGASLPAGGSEGDLLVWNDDDEAWEVLDASAASDGQVVQKTATGVGFGWARLRNIS